MQGPTPERAPERAPDAPDAPTALLRLDDDTLNALSTADLLLYAAAARAQAAQRAGAPWPPRPAEAPHTAADRAAAPTAADAPATSPTADRLVSALVRRTDAMPRAAAAAAAAAPVPAPLPDPRTLLDDLLVTHTQLEVQHYFPLPLERVAELKQMHARLAHRLDAVQYKLTLEQRMRSATAALRTARAIGASFSEEYAASVQVAQAMERTDRVMQEHMRLTQQMHDIDREILQHHTAVLRDQLARTEARRAVDAPGAARGLAALRSASASDTRFTELGDVTGAPEETEWHAAYDVLCTQLASAVLDPREAREHDLSDSQGAAEGGAAGGVAQGAVGGADRAAAAAGAPGGASEETPGEAPGEAPSAASSAASGAARDATAAAPRAPEALLAQLVRQRDALQARVDAYATLDAELAQVRAERDTLAAEAVHAQRAREAAERAADEHRTARTRADDALASHVAEHAAVVDELQTALAARPAAADVARDRAARDAEQAETAAALAAVRAQYADATAELEAMQKAHADAMEELTALHEALGAATQELRAEQQAHTGAAEELATVKRALTGATEELTAVKRAHADALEELGTLRTAHADATTELGSLRTAHADATSELGTLRSAHADATTELDTLRTAHADATTELGTLRSAHADATTELDTLRTAHADATSELGTLRDAHADATTELDTLRKAHAAATADATEHRRALEQANAEHAAALAAAHAAAAAATDAAAAATAATAPNAAPDTADASTDSAATARDASVPAARVAAPPAPGARAAADTAAGATDGLASPWGGVASSRAPLPEPLQLDARDTSDAALLSCHTPESSVLSFRTPETHPPSDAASARRTALPPLALDLDSASDGASPSATGTTPLALGGSPRSAPASTPATHRALPAPRSAPAPTPDSVPTPDPAPRRDAWLAELARASPPGRAGGGVPASPRAADTLGRGREARTRYLEMQLDKHRRAAEQSRAAYEELKARMDAELDRGRQQRDVAQRWADEWRRLAARLEQQDRFCARVLGKDDGREEMDELLSQIKAPAFAGAPARAALAERSQAAVDEFERLIAQLEEHISDMAEGLARAGASGLGGNVIAQLEDQIEDLQAQLAARDADVAALAAADGARGAEEHVALCVYSLAMVSALLPAQDALALSMSLPLPAVHALFAPDHAATPGALDAMQAAHGAPFAHAADLLHASGDARRAESRALVARVREVLDGLPHELAAAVPALLTDVFARLIATLNTSEMVTERAMVLEESVQRYADSAPVTPMPDSGEFDTSA